MRSFISYKTIVFLWVAVSIPLMMAVVENAHSSEVAFKMAIISKTADGSEIKNINKEAILQSGDMFKIHFKSLKPCYMYLIFLDSSGELLSLYQPDPSNETLAFGTVIHLPQEKDWYILDDQKGEERLYLMVFFERPVELDKLLAEYTGAHENLKEKIKKGILNKIKEIKRKQIYKSFNDQIDIAGNVRGLVDHEHALVNVKEIHAQTFYSKTILIHHK